MSADRSTSKGSISSAAIEISSVRFDALTSDQLSIWESLRSRGGYLHSPFFSPHFIQLTSKVCPQTRVGVLSKQGQAVGFWPFEAAGRSGRPAAAAVNEIAGIIATEDLDWKPEQFLEPLGLANWTFDCIAADEPAMMPYELCRQHFPIISLRDGFEAYCDRLKAGKSRQIEQNTRKSRRIERDHGRLRWVWQDGDPLALEQLFRWKRDQYQRTGAGDVLGIPWVRALVQSIHEYQSPTFGGVLSTLYLGDRLIAAHFGMLDRKVLSSWFPAYDPAFSAYSPGIILFLKVIQEAASRGITCIELGQGGERYKASFGNGSFIVSEGVVCRNTFDRLLHLNWIRARQFAQSNRYCRTPLRWFRSLRNRQLGVER